MSDNNSIFVICGRGNCSLDCFRIYEAIVAGAIPVIVGNLDEIQTTFNYNNNYIPFIHDDSWEKVVVKCNDLLKDYDKLEQIRNDLKSWWNNEKCLLLPPYLTNYLFYTDNYIVYIISYRKHEINIIFPHNFPIPYRDVLQ
jgi:hypothetical protein